MGVSVKFLISRQCNYNCFFCHNEFQEKNLDEGMSFDCHSVFRILKDIQEQHGIESMKFSGGEPLIRLKHFVDLLRCVRSFNVKKILLTNGALLSNIVADKIIALGITEVRFNMPHYSANKYAEMTGANQTDYQEARRKMQRLKDLGMDIRVNVVVTGKAFHSGEMPLSCFVESFLDEFPEYSVSFILQHRLVDSVNLHEKLRHAISLLAGNDGEMVSKRKTCFIVNSRKIMLLSCIDPHRVKDLYFDDTDVYVYPPGNCHTPTGNLNVITLG